MPHICAIGGGKGGSGKTFICANLGVLLAAHGKKVILVDLDLGASNLHTLVGQSSLKTGLHDFLNKSVKDLSLTAQPTDITGLHLISSLRCSIESGNLFYVQKQKIIKAIGRLPADFVLLDLGAGTTYNTLDFFLTAHPPIASLIRLETIWRSNQKRFWARFVITALIKTPAVIGGCSYPNLCISWTGPTEDSWLRLPHPQSLSPCRTRA